MKKSFIYHLFSIIILSNTIMNYGMITKTRQLMKKPYFGAYKSSAKPTIYHPKTYQPLTRIDRVKQLYSNFKNKVYTFWYGQPKLHETIEIIKQKKTEWAESLDTFLQENDQKTVNALLSKLVFSENGLVALNAYIFWLRTGEALGLKIHKKFLKKVINWTKDNIVQLFGLDLPINEEFFLFGLLSYNLELIPSIHDNLAYIQKKPAGEKFLTLLQKHTELYNAIIQRKQTPTKKLRELFQKSEKQFRLRAIRRKIQSQQLQE